MARAGARLIVDEASPVGAASQRRWQRALHWLLPKLRCGACGTVTTADPPGGRAGTVVYGPNVNAAAILLDNEGNVPAERTAMLMGALLGAPVSAGFVARAHERLAQRLEAAGFDETMKAGPARTL